MFNYDNGLLQKCVYNKNVLITKRCLLQTCVHYKKVFIKKCVYYKNMFITNGSLQNGLHLKKRLVSLVKNFSTCVTVRN